MASIRVGHSADPDDAFMFWALEAGRVGTRGLEFEQVVSDIQTLNEWATEGRLEVTAISAGAYPHVADRYILLPHGASMGDGYGPIVVAREELDLHDVEIVIPGRLTTAYLVLRLALGDVRVRELPFDEIVDEVTSGRAEAGLLIHEGQLMFSQIGLHRVVDLGQWWQETTGLPLPLGANAIRRRLGSEMGRQVARVIRESVTYALEHREPALNYALQFARDMDPVLADKFIGMYVNRWTLDYGEEGRRAVRELLARGAAVGLVPSAFKVEFLSEAA
jgi:1,4-dihydroxy-6-naphthoate synthase